MTTKLNDHKARAHALLSASSSARWMACPASARLADQYPNIETPFTVEGTWAHEVAEAIASGRLKPEQVDITETVTDEMVRHASNYRDYILGLSTPETDRLLEVRVDFSPWVPEGFGTADCILLHDDVMEVIDYKYGAGVAVDAVDNPQLMLYGLGALNDYGFVYEVQTVRLNIFQPRMDNISVAEYTVADLLAFGEKVKTAAAEAYGEDPSIAAGSHCKFCPHAGRCSELAISSLKACSAGPEMLPHSLGPEAVGQVLKLEPMISAWLKKVKEQALADMLNGERVPGFKVVEGKLGNRKWTNEQAVMAALAAAGYAADVYTTVTLLSPAAMDKALGKKTAAELLSKMIDRAPGSPTVAPESDKREPLDRVAAAQKDFE